MRACAAAEQMDVPPKVTSNERHRKAQSVNPVSHLAVSQLGRIPRLLRSVGYDIIDDFPAGLNGVPCRVTHGYS